MEQVAVKEHHPRSTIEVERAVMAEQKRACYKIRHDVFINETGYLQKKTITTLKQMSLMI